MKMLRCTLGVLRPVFARQACLRVAGYQSATDAAAEQAQLVADRKGKRRVTELFDRPLKVLHRDRAAQASGEPDPLLDATTSHLLDRILDTKRKFPVVAVLGGTGPSVLRQLPQYNAGIERLIYIDTSQAMLDAAERQEQETNGAEKPHVETLYIQGNEEELPLSKHSVDLIISNLGMHWINDLPASLFQCQLALKPDGLFLGSMLGGNTLQELRIAFALAEQERESGVSPRVSPMAQVNDAGSLLSGAGFNLCAVDVDNVIIKYQDLFKCMQHLRNGKGLPTIPFATQFPPRGHIQSARPNVPRVLGESNGTVQRRHLLSRDTMLAAAAIYQSLFCDDDMVQTTYQVIYMSGWSPHESQQKPKRRGSATVSLKDLDSALGGEIKHPKG